MADLPEFARERLRQQRGAEPHPDADLISAFVENSLTTRERVQVLEHLSRCDTCRAVAGMAVPEPETPPMTVHTREERAWARWTVMRWATLAASAVVVAIAVLVLRPHERPTPSFSDMQTAAARSEAKPAEPRAQEPKPRAEESDTSAKSAAPGVVAPPSSRARASAKGKTGDAGEGDKKALFGYSPQPPLAAPPAQTQTNAVTSQTSNTFAQNSQQQMRPIGGPYANQNQIATQQNQNVPTVPAATSQVADQAQRRDTPTGASQGAGRAGGVIAGQAVTVNGIPAAPPSAPAKEEMAKAAPPPPPPRVDTDKAQPAKAPGYANETVEVTGAEAASAQNTLKLKDIPKTASVPAAEATGGGMTSARRAHAGALDGGPLAVRWIISATGEITRSTDAGKTWAGVPVAKGVTFRTVSANGADVWAGGSAGALYHSSDGGNHWQRVRPNVSGMDLKADITRVEFTNPQHGIVLTAAGEQWITRDAGRTWTITR